MVNELKIELAGYIELFNKITQEEKPRTQRKINKYSLNYILGAGFGVMLIMAGLIFGLMYARLGNGYKKVIITTCSVGPFFGVTLFLIFLWLRNKIENKKETLKPEQEQDASNHVIQEFDKFAEKFEVCSL